MPNDKQIKAFKDMVREDNRLTGAEVIKKVFLTILVVAGIILILPAMIFCSLIYGATKGK